MICNCLCDVIFSFVCLIAMYIVNLLSTCDFSAFVIPKESLPRHSNQLRFFFPLSFSLKRETQNVLVSPIFLEQAKRKKKNYNNNNTNKQTKQKKRKRKARFIL